MANVESKEIEYSIFFALFSKGKEDALRLVLKKSIDSEYFAVLFHRDIFKYITELHKARKTLSLGMFERSFLKRPNAKSDDDLKFSIFKENVTKNKIAMGDLGHACDILIESYVCRRFLSELDDSVDNLTKLSSSDLLESVQQSYRKYRRILDQDSISREMGLKSGLEARIKRAKEVKANPDVAGMVKTGLKNIDNFIGRQSPGCFVIYQARTGVGKSVMLMGTAIANFKAGLKVMVITIEMSDYDYLYRFDSNLTGFEHRVFVSGDITTDDEKINYWRKKIKNCGKPDSDLMVYWVPSNCTPAKVDALVAANPFKPDLLIVDYAGDMDHGMKGIPKYDARGHAEIYSSLKEVAGIYNCVVYTAQQSKRGTKGKADTESGSWSDVASNKADIMFAVEVTKEDQDFITEVDGKVVIGRMTVSTIKGRNVPSCKTHIIPRFSKMSWLEKESEKMIPCGAGKEISTTKKQMSDKIQEAQNELVETIDKVDKEDLDLYAEE